GWSCVVSRYSSVRLFARGFQIERQNRSAVAHVERRARERGHRPGVVRHQRHLRVYFQTFSRWRRQRQIAVFVEQDEAAFGQQEAGARETAVTPGDFAGLDIDRREWRGAEIAARPVNEIADADARPEMHAHQAVKPDLFNHSPAAVSLQPEDAAAAVITRRDEEQIVFAPDRRGRVEAEIGLVRMAPQQVALVRVNADDLAMHKRDELLLAVNVDEDRR